MKPPSSVACRPGDPDLWFVLDWFLFFLQVENSIVDVTIACVSFHGTLSSPSILLYLCKPNDLHFQLWVAPGRSSHSRTTSLLTDPLPSPSISHKASSASYVHFAIPDSSQVIWSLCLKQEFLTPATVRTRSSGIISVSGWRRSPLSQASMLNPPFSKTDRITRSPSLRKG